MSDGNSIVTLGDDLPVQMARVRDEIIPAYEALGVPGRMVVAQARADLDAAARAMIRQDIVAMVQVYQSLREYQL